MAGPCGAWGREGGGGAAAGGRGAGSRAELEEEEEEVVPGIRRRAGVETSTEGCVIYNCINICIGIY